MGFIYQGRNYPSLQQFVTNGTKLAQESRSHLQFAHPVDDTLMKALNSNAVKNAIGKIVELYVSQQSGIMISTGITVNPFNYSKLYDCLISCCSTLGIDVPQMVITPQMPGINASAIGTSDFAFIAISDLAQVLLPNDQLKFIIGHECGHIALEHVLYHTIGSCIANLGTLIPGIGPILAKTVSLPLNAWSRYSEVSADRAGLLCCGDLKTAQRALLRLSGGFTETDDVCIDNYIEQSLDSLETHKVGAVMEYFYDHPLIPKRLKALDLFAHSEMYYRCISKPITETDKLFNDDCLNSMVNNIIKVM